MIQSFVHAWLPSRRCVEAHTVDALLAQEVCGDGQVVVLFVPLSILQFRGKSLVGRHRAGAVEVVEVDMVAADVVHLLTDRVLVAHGPLSEHHDVPTGVVVVVAVGDLVCNPWCANSMDGPALALEAAAGPQPPEALSSAGGASPWPSNGRLL